MDSQQAQAELNIIKTIMADSRKIAIDNGIHYIFWGLVVTAALITNYIFLLTRVSGQYIGLLWFVLMTSAWVVSAFIAKREAKARKVRTFAGKILSAMWMASGITMMIFGFVATVSGAINRIFICPVISTVLGANYYTSGVLHSQKWLRNLSYGWWAGAIGTFIFPSVHTLAIFALMMICFQTIPGIILNKKWKQSEQASAELL
jgi:hypothetical protein